MSPAANVYTQAVEREVSITGSSHVLYNHVNCNFICVSWPFFLFWERRQYLGLIIR